MSIVNSNRRMILRLEKIFVIEVCLYKMVTLHARVPVPREIKNWRGNCAASDRSRCLLSDGKNVPRRVKPRFSANCRASAAIRLAFYRCLFCGVCFRGCNNLSYSPLSYVAASRDILGRCTFYRVNNFSWIMRACRDLYSLSFCLTRMQEIVQEKMGIRNVIGYSYKTVIWR